MTSTTRRLIGIAAISTALLIAPAGPALATSPAPSALPQMMLAAQPALLDLAAARTIVPGDRESGYPNIACTPFNDGEEVQTLLVVLFPSPIATVLSWRCHGQTGTWRRI